jgi:WD40 repeat protein
VVTAGADGSVIIWDARSGGRIRELRGHSQDALWAAYHPDGRRIVTASGDETARVWDAETGRELLLVRCRFGPLRCARFSPDGARLVTTGSMWRVPPPPNVIETARDYPVTLWSADTGKELIQLLGHTDIVTSAAFDPSGRRIVTAGEDETARVWDVATGELMGSWIGHTKAIVSVAYSPDGSLVATASHDGSARVWSAAAGIALSSWRVSSSGVATARYSPDGRRVLAGSLDGRVTVLDAVRGTNDVVLSHPRPVAFAAFLPNDAGVVTADAAGTLRIWNAASRAVVSSFGLGGPKAKVLAISRDGSTIVSGGPGAPTCVRDVTSGLCTSTLPVEAAAAGLSPDRTRVVTSDSRNAIDVWDAHSGERVSSLPRQQGAIEQVAYSPDGRRIATAGWDETVRLWDATRGALLVSLTGHRKGVRALDFSPDGVFVVTGSGDRSVKVWDSGTGNLLASFEGHRHDVRDVNYSPDGSSVVSAGGDDGTVRVWNTRLADAREIERLTMLRVPWRFVNGRLNPKPLSSDPGATGSR